MSEIAFSEIIKRAIQIRKLYHELGRQHHETKWTIEEDALAFLTDAGLVGRLAMAQQGRWPISEKESPDLEHKLGECMWWLIVLAERMNVNVQDALQSFIIKAEGHLSSSNSSD